MLCIEMMAARAAAVGILVAFLAVVSAFAGTSVTLKGTVTGFGSTHACEQAARLLKAEAAAIPGLRFTYTCG